MENKRIEVSSFHMHEAPKPGPAKTTIYTRYYRVKKKGGGVCMYVREYIKCSSMSLHPNSLSEYVEVLWSECRYGRAIYYTAACYHPPRLVTVTLHLKLN